MGEEGPSAATHGSRASRMMISKPKRRTVVQVIDSPVAKHGSFEDFMIELAIQSTSAGIDLHFIFPAIGAAGVKALIEAAGATVSIVPGNWHKRSGARAMTRVLNRINPHVADFHFCGAGAFLAVYLNCQASRTKVVYHYHGEIRPLETLRWRNRHISALRLISLLVDLFVPVSHANAAFLRALRVHAPMMVVHNGLHIEKFRRSAVARESSPLVHLLSVGSLIHRKRVDVLLRAFAMLGERQADVTLTIVGGGQEEAALRELAATLGLESRVTFTGLLAEYPYSLLSNADVFVSASESESFGLMFTEAMAYSVPVVACNVGGIPEVVVHGLTGLLVPPGQPAALAAALETLVVSPSMRRTMGIAGLAHARANFDLTARVRDLVQLLSGAAN